MVIFNFPRLTYRYKQRIVNWEKIMRRKHYFVFFENFDQVWQLKLKKKYLVLFIWNIVKLYRKLLFSEIIGTLMTRGEIVEKYKVYNVQYVHTVGIF